MILFSIIILTMGSEAPYSTAQAAALLGVTRATVIAWVRMGPLRGRQREGGKREWEVEADSVQQYLRASGPGGRRGRPAGAAAAQIDALRRRVEALEASIVLDTRTWTVVAGLVGLLQEEGSSRLVRSEELARAADELAALMR